MAEPPDLAALKRGPGVREAILVTCAVAVAVLFGQAAMPRTPDGGRAGVHERLERSERYLESGDIERARAEASMALHMSGGGPETTMALRLAGWTNALAGRPEEGAAMLEQCLDRAPEDRNAKWYLANVRLVGLGDREGALALFRELLVGASPSERHAIDARIRQALSPDAAVR